MKFVRDLHNVSEFLFFSLGFAILVGLVFWNNDFYAYEAELFLRYGDIPFAFISLLFGGTSLRLSFAHENEDESENPILDAILILVGILLFFAIVYVDFAFVDVL